MTREQIEGILKTSQAKQEKDGGYVLPEGGSITFHVSHDGASLGVQKIDHIRFEGELVYAKSSKMTVALVASDIFAVGVEGAGGTPARRPAGFG
jgi:hypothetical protein